MARATMPRDAAHERPSARRGRHAPLALHLQPLRLDVAVEAARAPEDLPRMRDEQMGPPAEAEPFLAEAGRPADDPGERRCLAWPSVASALRFLRSRLP